MSGRSAALLSKFWSSTLKLPRTDFPARIDSHAAHGVGKTSKPPVQLARDLYIEQKSSRPQNQTFVLQDGPPYANGPLHLGHAVNKILKDVICRVELLNGKRIVFQPGFDCHGLPIENKVLQQLSEKAGPTTAEKDAKHKQFKGYSAVEIRQAARKLAAETIVKQTRTFEQWGILADWKNPYKTMDSTYEIKQLKIFRGLVSAGLVSSRVKPVFWSPTSETALAEAELVYREDHLSKAAYVKFPTTQDVVVEGRSYSDVSLVIWTTTPWTIPANRAIAVNPKVQYSIISSNRYGYLLVAESRAEELKTQILQKDEQDDILILGKILGQELVGRLHYQHPFESKSHPPRPVIAADFVSEDSGTGLVHCAPGHGEEDFRICQDLGIPAFVPVDESGCFTSEAMPEDPQRLQGLSVLGSGQHHVLKFLQAQQLLVATHKHQHSYPYDWRTKHPVIYRATKQWFVDINPIKERVLRSLSDVNFKPEMGKNRLSAFVKNREAWCISRQRAWGVPIPAFENTETGESLLSPDTIDHVISVIDKRGIDAWFSDPPDELGWIPEKYRHMKAELRRGTDTMDVWFDSGTSWSQNPDGLRAGSADIYIEGSDQHRGWFQSSLLTKNAYQSALPEVQDIVPFRMLITHGFVLDGNGQKMSKSLGNVVDPQQIIDGSLLQSSKSKRQLGTATGVDSLRFLIAGMDYTKDMAVGSKTLLQSNANLAKLRVTLRFLLGNLRSFDPKHAVDYHNLLLVDKLALLWLSTTSRKVKESLQNYDFAKATNTINDYVSFHLSAFYFKGVKERLYVDEENGVSRHAVQTVLHQQLNHLLAMITPFVPHLVDEVWVSAPEAIKREEIHPLQGVWPLAGSCWSSESLLEVWSFAKDAMGAMNVAWSKASDNGLKGGEVTCSAAISVPSPSPSFLKEDPDTIAQLLNSVFGTTSVKFHLDKGDGGSYKYQPLEELGSGQRGFAYPAQFPVRDGVQAELWLIPAKGWKCARCWTHSAPIGNDDTEETRSLALCGRCEEVVQKQGLPTAPSQEYLQKRFG